MPDSVIPPKPRRRKQTRLPDHLTRAEIETSTLSGDPKLIARVIREIEKALRGAPSRHPDLFPNFLADLAEMFDPMEHDTFAISKEWRLDLKRRHAGNQSTPERRALECHYLFLEVAAREVELVDADPTRDARARAIRDIAARNQMTERQVRDALAEHRRNRSNK